MAKSVLIDWGDRWQSSCHPTALLFAPEPGGCVRPRSSTCSRRSAPTMEGKDGRVD